jgi:hypothetical protein
MSLFASVIKLSGSLRRKNTKLPHPLVIFRPSWHMSVMRHFADSTRTSATSHLGHEPRLAQISVMSD